MIPDLLYWQAVARGIDAEDQKLRVFVRHKLSLGIAREAILRQLLVTQTPEPYRVRTGFICYFTEPEPWLSRQCDVLVYDPQVSQPYYSLDEFSVISREAACLVVEIKTEFHQAALDEIVQVAQDARSIAIPTLGFAFSGVLFNTALEKIANAIKADRRSAPDCVAVHGRNYVIFRPHFHYDESTSYTGFDFSGLGAEGEGLATAMLLSLCDLWIRNHLGSWSPPKFFSKLDAGKIAAATISPAGEVGPYSFG